MVKSVAFLLFLAMGSLAWADREWTGELNTIALQRGNFQLLRYPPDLTRSEETPKALVIFGSGCSGWSDFERHTSHQLQTAGYDVLGIDFAAYAKTDYNLTTLQGDYDKIVRFGFSLYPGKPAPPVIIGGWSTGAEQAVAVAAGPNPPPGLIGLFLISPGSEGAFGTCATNYFNLTSPKTKIFSLANLAGHLDPKLRIVQWHAQFDPFDSRAWLSALTVPHREFDFGAAVHDYGGCCAEFLAQVNGSIQWIFTGDSGPAAAHESD